MFPETFSRLSETFEGLMYVRVNRDKFPNKNNRYFVVRSLGIGFGPQNGWHGFNRGVET